MKGGREREQRKEAEEREGRREEICPPFYETWLRPCFSHMFYLCLLPTSGKRMTHVDCIDMTSRSITIIGRLSLLAIKFTPKIVSATKALSLC